jgi:2-amino-4-hydroxy-6-hydroxymethyldihydropteridine diphosphokinase
MNLTVAYLALGSNIGDCAANLQHAAQMLDAHPQINVVAKSKLYETQSVEGGGPDDFLNAALRLETGFSARALLEVCREIESTLGRPQPPRHGPRLIDIDILLFGDEIIDEPDLQVPHPRMHRRAFVLKPLLDVLEGGWVREAAQKW